MLVRKLSVIQGYISNRASVKTRKLKPFPRFYIRYVRRLPVTRVTFGIGLLLRLGN